MPSDRGEFSAIEGRSNSGRTRFIRALSLRRLFWFIVAIGVVWRLVRFWLFMPIWGDEAFVAINFLRRDFAGLIEPLLYGQVAPLGFMWIEEATSRLLGYGEYALRLLPHLSGLASLALFAWFARRSLPRGAAVLAVGFFAASYYIVRLSAEVKPYATDLFWSLLLTVLAYRLLHGRTRSAGWADWAALAIVAAAGVWCSYTAVFVAVGIGAVLAWRAVWPISAAASVRVTDHTIRRVSLPGVVAFAVVAGGSTLAMWWFIARPHGQAVTEELAGTQLWAQTFPPIREPAHLLGWLLVIHTGEMFAYPQGGAPPGSVATLAFFVVGVIYLWRRSRDVALLWLAPFAVNLAVAAAGAYPYGGRARICQHLAPAICWLAGLGVYVVTVRLLRPRGVRRAIAGWLIAFTALAIGGIAQQIVRPYESIGVQRTYRAIRNLAAATGPEDCWITFNADARCDYAPYLGDWRGIGGQWVFDVARMCPVTLTWAPRPEDVIARAGGSVWLLCYHIENQRTATFPEAQWQAYLGAFKQKFGAPVEERPVLLHEKAQRAEPPPGLTASAPARPDAMRRETMRIYRFAGGTATHAR